MAENFGCIRGALSDKIDAARLDELEESYNRYRRAHPDEPHQRITDRMLADIQSRRNKRIAVGVSQVNANARVQEFMAGGKTKAEQAQRGRWILSRDPTGRFPFADNFETMRDVYRRRLHTHFAAAIQKLSPRWFHQVEDRALIGDVGRALVTPGFKATGEAAVLAKGIQSMFDDVLQRMRAKGIRVGETPNFIPAQHDAAKVQKATAAEWIAEIKARNDFSLVKDYETGLPFTASEDSLARLDEKLAKIYTNITQDGMDLYDALNQTNRSYFVDKFEQSRFFRWKSFEDWKAYQEKFGNGGNLMDTLTHYVNSSARDLAILHTLGPDPVRTLNEVKRAVQGLVGPQRARGIQNAIDNQWFLVNGQGSVAERAGLAVAEEVGSSLVRMASLGLSGIAAVNDQVLAGSTRHFYGLSVAGGLPDLVKDLGAFYSRNQSPRMERFLHNGVGAETMLSGMIGAQRAQGEFVGSRVLNRANDAFYRINMNMPLTEATRAGAEAAAYIGLRKTIEEGLDAAPRMIRETLAGYGIKAADLERLKPEKYAADMRDGLGINFPAIMDDFGDSAAAPLIALVNDIKSMSSPTPSIDLRASLRAGNSPGTLQSLVRNSYTMFWQFPAAAFQEQILRRWYSSQSKATTGAQVAGVVIAGTLLGTLLVQSRQIVSGREPYDWQDPELWGSAFMISGMAGVTGDYVSNVVTGRLTGDALLGPVAVPVLGAARVASALATQAQGGEASVMGPIFRSVRSITPGQNLPLWGVAFNRIVLDQLRILVDDDAQKAFKSQERYMKKGDFGREFLWRPGQTLPEFAQ